MSDDLMRFISFYIPEDDPDAPRALEEYHGIKLGDRVLYRNPAWGDQTGGMDPPLVVSELVAIDTEEGVHTIAVINDGEWEVNADNLVLE